MPWSLAHQYSTQADPQRQHRGPHGERHGRVRRSRVRLVNTDNGPQTAWANVPYRVRAVDGYDVNRPTAVTDRSIGIPAGGKVDLELTAPPDGSDARVELLGGVGIVIGPPGAGSTRPVSKPKDKLDLLSYGSPATVPFDVRTPDRRFTYSIGRRPGFVNGQAGHVVERERQAVPRPADGHGQGGRGGPDDDLQPQQRGAPDAPARPSRRGALSETATKASGSPVVVRLPGRASTARSSSSRSWPTTRGSGWTTATTSSTQPTAW